MPERTPYREFQTKVVGVTFENADGASRQSIISRCGIGEDIELVREPDNPHDANAVAVTRRRTGEQIGYLSRDVAGRFVEQAESGQEFSAEICEIIGGGGWFSKESFGVVLKIGVYHPEGDDQ